MIIIRDVLISDDVIEEQFMCNLNACKGACCWEGDFGAPLETAELQILTQIFEKVKPYLSEAGKHAIEEKGLFTYYKEAGEYGTALQPGGACVFMIYDPAGVAKCAIEQAWQAGEVDFKKPISCHLYPVRVAKNKEVGFEALNYDRWDICSAACKKGRQEKMPVYRFVREALVRKYGEDFFEELEAAVNRADAQD